MASTTPALQPALQLHDTAPLLALHGHLTCRAACLQVPYLDKSPLVAIQAVSIMAGFGKQFTSQHYLVREAVDVPAECVEALLPGAAALPQQQSAGTAQVRGGPQ